MFDGIPDHLDSCTQMSFGGNDMKDQLRKDDREP